MNSILGTLAFFFIIIGADGVPPNLFEGDIILSKYEMDHLDAFLNGTLYTGNTRNAILGTHYYWPSTDTQSGLPKVVVPYIFKDVSEETKNAFHQAIGEYNAKTCIRFEPRSNEADYIQVIEGDGCYSYVGGIGGGQEVSIGWGCAHKGIVVHELMHAIGFWHEQSRKDRDEYIMIKLANVVTGFENNFDKHNGNTLGEDYDYCSVMHYGEYAFSKNGKPTIVPLKETNCTGSTLGQREGLSDLDVKKINKLYCDWDGGLQSTTTTTTTTKTPTDICVDNEEDCALWAQHGFCQQYGDYMLKNCAKSCKACDTTTPPKCKNKKKRCDAWAKKGHCTKRKHFMAKRCKKSCGLC